MQLDILKYHLWYYNGIGYVDRLVYSKVNTEKLKRLKGDTRKVFQDRHRCITENQIMTS